MDPVRLGTDIRTLRRRRGWTQARLGTAAGVGRWAVSEIENGRGGHLTLDSVAAIAMALGGYLSARLLYHGEALDRLRDRDHASLVEQVVGRLRAMGWEVATEVTFSVFGERGSIDILAFHRATGALLVIEVKTVIPDVGWLLSTLDRKARLAAEVATERGWSATTVSRLLIVRDGSTSRRRVSDQVATFKTAFPTRGREVNRWLREPSSAMSGLWFLPLAAHTGTRRRRPASTEAPARRPRSS